MRLKMLVPMQGLRMAYNKGEVYDFAAEQAERLISAGFAAAADADARKELKAGQAAKKAAEEEAAKKAAEEEAAKKAAEEEAAKKAAENQKKASGA